MGRPRVYGRHWRVTEGYLALADRRWGGVCDCGFVGSTTPTHRRYTLEVERAAEVDGEVDEVIGIGVGGGVEEEFECARDLGASGVAEHAEGAGEFVGGDGGVAAERGGKGG